MEKRFSACCLWSWDPAPDAPALLLIWCSLAISSVAAVLTWRISNHTSNNPASFSHNENLWNIDGYRFEVTQTITATYTNPSAYRSNFCPAIHMLYWMKDMLVKASITSARSASDLWQLIDFKPEFERAKLL